MVLAYGSYPIAVAYFVWKRKDLQYRWLYLAFLQWIHSDLRQHPPDLGRDGLAPAVLAGCVYKGTGCRGRCGNRVCDLVGNPASLEPAQPGGA